MAAGEVARRCSTSATEIAGEEFPGERLIVCRNPLLVDERERKREELLAATERKLTQIVATTQRTHQPLRGEAETGIRLGKMIDHYRVGKHFVTGITSESFSFRCDEEKIAADQALDRLYNVEPQVFDAAQTVRAYKGLSPLSSSPCRDRSVSLTGDRDYT